MKSKGLFFRWLQSYTPWLLSLVILALFTGCPLDTRQSSLDPKGPVAQIQYDLFMITVWVTLAVFIVVGGILVWVVIRYRERKGDEHKPLPSQSHGNPLIEIGLIAISVGLLVIIAIPTLEAIWYTHELPEDEQSQLGSWYTGRLSPDDREDVLEVNVIGWQWWWSFEYPQFGVVTGNELVIPAGKVVKLNLRSEDVIHSFWLPKVAGKVDLIPGRRNWMWIQADEVGHYYGQCAEFCGEAHAYMMFRADAIPASEFAGWIAKMQSPVDHLPNVGGPLEIPSDFSPEQVTALEGKQLFLEKTCIRCHTVEGNTTAAGTIGPNLSNIYERKSLAAGFMDHQASQGAIDRDKQAQNLFNWIYQSHTIKPGNLMYYGDGLRELFYTGLTLERLQSIGLDIAALQAVGASDAVVEQARSQPSADISAQLSRAQIDQLHQGLSFEQKTRISNYPTPEEVHKIVAYLMALN